MNRIRIKFKGLKFTRRVLDRLIIHALYRAIDPRDVTIFSAPLFIEGVRWFMPNHFSRVNTDNDMEGIRFMITNGVDSYEITLTKGKIEVNDESYSLVGAYKSQPHHDYVLNFWEHITRIYDSGTMWVNKKHNFIYAKAILTFLWLKVNHFDGNVPINEKVYGTRIYNSLAVSSAYYYSNEGFTIFIERGITPVVPYEVGTLVPYSLIKENGIREVWMFNIGAKTFCIDDTTITIDLNLEVLIKFATDLLNLRYYSS